MFMMTTLSTLGPRRTNGAGKMSALWTGTPTTVRLDDLDIICAVLGCTTGDLLIHEPEAAAARRPDKQEQVGEATSVTPRLGRNRTLPPA